MKQILLTILAAITISVSACTTKDQTDSPTPVLSGPPATSFPMPPTSNAELGWVLGNGSRSRIFDYRGRVLILDFYATWCEPCRQSIPHLMSLQQKFEAKGLQVVGLNVGGPDDRTKVNAFAAELGIRYPLGFPDKALSDFFLSEDQSIPQTFVFGRDGRLLGRFIGYDRSIESELDKVVGDAVNSVE